MTLDHYCTLFSKLTRSPGKTWSDATRRRAPHKPLLLLAVMDMVARGAITSRFISIEGELVELNEPVKALQDAGAVVEIVSLKAGDFQGFNHLTPGDKVTADKAVAGVDAATEAAGISSRVRASTASRRALPGLKCGTCFSGMATLSPERGLRPMRGGRRLIEKLPNLKFMVLTGARAASLDDKAAAARGIPISTTPGGASNAPTAELGWALLMMPLGPSTQIRRTSPKVGATTAHSVPGCCRAFSSSHLLPVHVLPKPRPARMSQIRQSPSGGSCCGRAFLR